jgi:hypothetical protein
MRILEKPVPIGQIFLDLSNPRHEPLATEDEAIQYLCDKEEVWTLARDITAIGLNPLERVALIPIKGQKGAYTMAEGNRRLCALKLLADPDRAPAKLRKGFATLAAQRTPPKEFWAAEFADDEEVRLCVTRPWSAKAQPSMPYSGCSSVISRAYMLMLSSRIVPMVAASMRSITMERARPVSRSIMVTRQFLLPLRRALPSFGSLSGLLPR